MHRNIELIALMVLEIFKFEKTYTALWDTRYSVICIVIPSQVQPDGLVGDQTYLLRRP